MAGSAARRPARSCCPPCAPAPDEPLVGAVAVHRLLRAWREQCNGGPFWPVREPDFQQAEEVATR